MVHILSRSVLIGLFLRKFSRDHYANLARSVKIFDRKDVRVMPHKIHPKTCNRKYTDIHARVKNGPEAAARASANNLALHSLSQQRSTDAASHHEKTQDVLCRRNDLAVVK